eukprot:s4847_g7.t1
MESGSAYCDLTRKHEENEEEEEKEEEKEEVLTMSEGEVSHFFIAPDLAYGDLDRT